MVKAILLDALGTLIGFENPAPHLQSELQRRGHPVSLEEAERRHPRRDRVLPGAPARGPRRRLAARPARALRGGDGRSTGCRRRRRSTRCSPPCASSPTPTARPTLLALRERGIRLVVVSNWDFSLHERLAETGLTPLIDGALASAEVGSAKPDGAIFRAALRLAGTTPEQTWHVGDTPDGRRGGRPRGRHPPGPHRARGRPGRPARSVRSRNSYPWPQLDRREQRVPRLARTRGAVDARRRAARRRRRTRRSRCGRRSWRWPPRCSSCC